MQRYARVHPQSAEVEWEPVLADPATARFSAAARSIAQSLDAIALRSAPAATAGGLARLKAAARLTGAERRQGVRLPFRCRVTVAADGAEHECFTRDVGQGGMLVERPPDLISVDNRRCRIDVAGLGEIVCEIVAINFATISIRFGDETGTPFHDRLTRLMAALSLRNLMALSDATCMAAAVERAMEAALSQRRIDPHSLFAPPSVPLAGSDPQQRGHVAQPALREILAPVLAAFWKPERGVAYAVAIDRNGYVPLHNEPFSQAQRPGEPVFNHNFARDARIYDDLWTQCAARVADTPFVTVEERDVAPRLGQVVRAVSAPVSVMNRRWGAARIAWAMAEESADAFLPKDLAAEPVSPAGESAGPSRA